MALSLWWSPLWSGGRGKGRRGGPPPPPPPPPLTMSDAEEGRPTSSSSAVPRTGEAERGEGRRGGASSSVHVAAESASPRLGGGFPFVPLGSVASRGGKGVVEEESNGEEWERSGAAIDVDGHEGATGGPAAVSARVMADAERQAPAAVGVARTAAW